MLRSMTCFARKELSTDEYQLTLELKSVNSRYFDFHSRLPREFLGLEDRIRKFLKEKLIRGRVDLFVQYDSFEEKELSFEPNLSLANGYLKAVATLCEELNIVNSLQVGELLKLLKDAIKVKEAPTDIERLWGILFPPLQELVDEALSMAFKEGEITEVDIKKRLSFIKKLSEKIAIQFESSIKEQTEALKKRILSRLKDFSEIDENRLIQEAAILADRLDINEELVRLESHLSQFYKYLELDEQIGRKLDFLTQEIHREVNTIASKASDSTISHLVVEIKAELEKIREQLQNVV